MNSNIFLGIVAAMAYAMLFVFLAPIPEVGLLLFMLVFIVSIVSIMGVVFVTQIGSKVMFPVKLRLWEDRFGEPIITMDTRAKRIFKGKNKEEHYVTVSGRMLKAPERKNVIRGEKGSFIDLITTDGKVFLPFVPDLDTKNLKSINEDQRVWLANQVEENIKITTPPLDTLGRVLPVISMVTAIVLILVTFIVFTDQMPKFMEETAEVMKAQVRSLDASVTRQTEAVERFSAALDRVAICGVEPGFSTADTTPPPGF